MTDFLAAAVRLHRGAYDAQTFARALGDVLERLAGLDRDAINGIGNDLMADLEHLAAQVLGEGGESQ